MSVYCIFPLYTSTIGHQVTFSIYLDVNLFPDKISGRSFTGILHLIHQTSID